MHRSTHSPELLDAWLPPRVGRNARLERLTQLIDWAPLEALVAGLHAAPVGAAELSAAADGESAAAPAVVPGLGPCDGRGVVGAAVVPALRGVGTARRRAGSLDDQPVPHAADGGGRGRAAVRGGGAATGRAGDAGQAGHAGGRDVGGRAGAPPAGRRRQAAGSPRDLDAAWARRGRQERFGYKLHLGVDADSELIRRAVLTPANVNETQVADELIAGDEGAVYGDAAYGTHARSTRLRALGIADRLMRRPNKHHPRLGPAARRRHARIEQVRRPVEHVFGTLKRSYGYQRVRYRGLARNTTEMWFKLLAYNLRRADRLLAGAPASP